MSTRNLSALFAPKAIAIVGASNEPGSVGAIIARNMFEAGFTGALMAVNPHEDAILGHACWRSISALPQTPDLAVIATPPATIPSVIGELCAKGARAAIVITAGLDAVQRAAMLDAGRVHLMRVVGPNCLGFLSPGAGINASFSHLAPDAGDIAFLTQSGAIATSIIDWAKARGVGFSHVLSIGDMADVDFGDLLDFLAFDAATRSILIYAETITQARKFMSASRIAARAKPVIVVKAGRSTAGAKAAASHTGALAGADAVYDAAFRRAGMLRVETLRELFDAAETLASRVRPHGERLMIVTNGGGLGVLAADALEAHGGRLASLSEGAMSALDATLPRAWSRANPVDILGDASGARYRNALNAIGDENGHDAVLVMNCPTGVGDNLEAARTLVETHTGRERAPLLACWMGEATATAARRLLNEAEIPNYETPHEAVRAFLHLVEYGRNQHALLEVPAASAARTPAQREAAGRIIHAALAEGRSTLSEWEAKRVLAAYGVPVVETVTAATPAEAGAAADRFGGPVALKILSRHITHKSDVGGVRLDLVGARDVQAGAEAMLVTAAARAPGAVIEGFTVQPMVRRAHAHELILGAVADATFGPCLVFGQGGTATEIIADRVVGLPPLNAALAADMIRRTRVSRLLAGYRDRPRADHGAIVAALVALSDLVIDFAEIAELDINPLLADDMGVIALDARIIVREARDEAANRLAIRPYPEELERDIVVDGASLRLRPIRPEDATALADMARRTAPDDLRLRFHGAVGRVTDETAARLTQIDYDREMALAAVEPDGAIAGVVRLIFDPQFDTGEYAIIVRTDAQHHGLGHALMAAMLDHARARGAACVWGDVLRENHDMLKLAQEMGAERAPHADAPDVVRTRFNLARQ